MKPRNLALDEAIPTDSSIGSEERYTVTVDIVGSVMSGSVTSRGSWTDIGLKQDSYLS